MGNTEILKHMLDKHKPHGMSGNLVSLYQGYYMVQSEWLESHTHTSFARAIAKAEEWALSFKSAGVAQDIKISLVKKPAEGRGYVFTTGVPQEMADKTIERSLSNQGL